MEQETSGNQGRRVLDIVGYTKYLLIGLVVDYLHCLVDRPPMWKYREDDFVITDVNTRENNDVVITITNVTMNESVDVHIIKAHFDLLITGTNPIAFARGIGRKFITFNVDTLVAALTRKEQLTLGKLQEKVADYLRAQGKAPQYIIINADEGYAEQVIEILKDNGHWG